MRRTKLFLSAIVFFAVCLTGWTIVDNQQQREDDNFSKNVEALTLPAENPDGTPPCNNKNGFKQWSINGGLLQHKKIFMTAVINCVRVIPQKEHAKNR